ncbi:MAG: glycoside hydrolase [Spirochaetaceae bacterium]|nr:glycoside hydrolase [Spirochaetaceae bacterium]
MMRAAKTFFLCTLLILTLAQTSACRSAPPEAAAKKTLRLEAARIPPNSGRLPESEFQEVWGYVVAGRERSLKTNYPLSDIVYFGADVDRYGHVVDIPARKVLANYKGRVHISITCGSFGLTHFILEPDSKARATFVRELLAAARDYDGLNIDLEQLPLKDADNFISFLGELRAGLGSRVLSVCVPARTEESKTYNYKKIAAASDKVFVMAYDEHWSTSKPGPVASMKWCRDVAAYALKTIGAEKLVMGIPFYGRGWGDKSTSRALVHSTTEGLRKTNGITEIERENDIPKFKYEVLVTVTVYFEDDHSLATRMKMYQDMGINHIGFWRIGQESAGVWNLVRLTRSPVS